MTYDQIVSFIRANFPELESRINGTQTSFWVSWLPRKDGRAVRVKENGKLKRVASFRRAERLGEDPKPFDGMFIGNAAHLRQYVNEELEILRSLARAGGITIMRDVEPQSPCLRPRLVYGRWVILLTRYRSRTSLIQPMSERAKGTSRKSIASRSGQQRFRHELIDAYHEAVCCISGCTIARLIEAAHIVPFDGPSTNARSNGLLLRADLHTLFDLGLLRIAPLTHQVELHPSVMHDSTYRRFDRKKLPRLRGVVSDKALAAHFEEHAPSLEK